MENIDLPTTNTSTVRINGIVHFPGLTMASGDPVTSPILKRTHEKADNNDNLNTQVLAKLVKTSHHGALTLRITKAPSDGTVPAAFKFTNDIWMVVLEHCTPSVLRKARLLNKSFKSLIDSYGQMLVNSRFQVYGLEIQSLPEGLSERQFNILLEGKGCMGCKNPRVTATHWTWCKRWCVDCWDRNVMTEGFVRGFLTRMNVAWNFHEKFIAAMPWGMKDSWKNPHHLVEEADRPFAKIGLIKTFLKNDLYTIYNDFEALVPLLRSRPYRMHPATYATLVANWRQRIADLPQTRESFLDERITKTSKKMERAITIEKAVRAKAKKDKQAKEKNRESRKQFFLDRARFELPEVPTEAVIRTASFKAAIKIGRDGGSQRSWALLKKKIAKEWETALAAGKQILAENETSIEDETRDEEDKLAEENTLVEEDDCVEENDPEEEEEGETEPYSIWADRDLAVEYYRYSHRVSEEEEAGTLGPA